MPYKEGKYRHIPYRSKNDIKKGTYFTMTEDEAQRDSRITLRKKHDKRTLFVVGISKRTKNLIIQKIMIPKD